MYRFICCLKQEALDIVDEATAIEFKIFDQFGETRLNDGIQGNVMTDPITMLTASAIASLAFQEFIKSGAGELAKKFTEEAIAKMGQLRSLIWDKLRGNPDAETALTNVENGQETDLADIRTYRKAKV
jgi:hypothetical protein